MRNLQLWDDLFAYNPKLKFIYLVRRPLDRIVSSYLHTYQIGLTDKPIESAVFQEPLFLDITRYHTQISPFVSRFGRKQVLILDFDDMMTETEKTLGRVATFLDVEPGLFAQPTLHANKTVGSSKVPWKLRKIGDLGAAINRKVPAIGAILRPAWRHFAYSRSRAIKERPELTPKAKAAIIHALDLEIDAIGELMGKDLSSWKEY